MPFKKTHLKVMNAFIYTLLTVVPPVATGGICQYVHTVQTAEATYSTLFTLGNTIFSNLTSSVNGISYSMTILAHSDDFHALNKEAIQSQLDLARYYNPKVFNNIIVVDSNNNFIYGITDEDLHQATYLQQALSTGQTMYDYRLNNNIPIIKVCYPILKDHTSKQYIGAIICDINIDSLDAILSSVNVFGDNIEAYIVDNTGVLISTSRYIPNAKGKLRMDIDKIKLSIDYDPYKPFKNYNNKDCYGAYFKIPNMNWTLVVTDNLNASNSIMNTIGYISAISGASGVGTLEIIKKLKETKKISSELIAELQGSEDEKNV